MFQDEAGFGRINHPKYCWCEKGIRPSVPCHHIREYRYAYGAVEPLTGESCFLVMPYCNTACMNLFLRELSKQFPQDTILMCCDGAAWHKSGTLEVPENIVLFHIPPYTPEMNPIEQIWKEIRKRGFRNEVLQPWRKSLIVSAIPFARLPLIPFSALPDAIGLLKRLIRFWYNIGAEVLPAFSAVPYRTRDKYPDWRFQYATLRNVPQRCVMPVSVSEALQT